MPLITLSIEARLHARMRVGDTSTDSIPHDLTKKEQQALKIILDKYLSEAQQELQEFLNLTYKNRSKHDTLSLRANRHRTAQQDGSVRKIPAHHSGKIKHCQHHPV